VYVTCRRAVNHPSDPLKPCERGCFAYFHHKKWVWRRGLPWQARFLRLVAGGLPWQTRTSCLSDPKNRQTNPIYGVLVIYVGGSPPAISTQNHQNNYGQALYAVPTNRLRGNGSAGITSTMDKWDGDGTRTAWLPLYIIGCQFPAKTATIPT